jgi:hypothetical protein
LYNGTLFIICYLRKIAFLLLIGRPKALERQKNSPF